MAARLWRDLKDVWAAYNELFTRPQSDEDASFELAVSAREYSRNARAAVDDKLNFTATLMRAGEVDAAKQLFAEFEEEVRSEEAALIERVNEVKVAQALHREGTTRARLARTLAVAMLGSVLMAGSAIGMTVARVVQRDEPPAISARQAMRQGESRDARIAKRATRSGKRQVELIPGVKARMSPSQLRVYQELTAQGIVNATQLEAFLRELLPAPLAHQVGTAITAASTTTEQAAATAEEVVAAPKIVRETKRKAKSQTKKSDTTDPAPKPSQDPSPNPSPNEDPTDDDDDDEEGSQGGSSGEEEDGSETGLPFGDRFRP